jgi:subtilisin family serine protease
MSLGGGMNSTLNTAVENASKAGVTVVVAAGNSNADACTVSPASAPSAVTIGAAPRATPRSEVII